MTIASTWEKTRRTPRHVRRPVDRQDRGDANLLTSLAILCKENTRLLADTCTKWTRASRAMLCSASLQSPLSVLCCAVLCCAVLCCAVLCCAVLCCAVLCCAVLSCAVLCCVCKRWDLCWSATLPWNIAGYVWVENHRACLWRRARRKDRRSGWNGWERTCACGQCQVRQGMRHDTWMTIVFGTQRCATLKLEPRVFAWWNVIILCNSVSAVLVGVLFTPHVGWLEVFLQATETCPNSEKKCSPIVRTWIMLRIPIARLPMVWSHVDDEEVGPRSWRSCLQVSPRLFVEPPTCFRVNCVVVFFVALKLLSFSLSYLLTAKSGSVFLLGSCQVLVLQSFAFSFRLSKVGSSIEWLLSSSFCICRKNPMFRILSSFSSCGASPGRSCRTTLCGVLSTLWLAMTFCILRLRTIVKVSLNGLRAFPVGPF